MTGKGCFFIGHREASSEILPALEEAIEQHIVEHGVTEFIVGYHRIVCSPSLAEFHLPLCSRSVGFNRLSFSYCLK